MRDLQKKLKLNATYVVELGPDEDDWWQARRIGWSHSYLISNRQVRLDDPDKRRRVRLVRPGAQPALKKAKKAKPAAAKKKAAAVAKKPAKKKAKAEAPEDDNEAPGSAVALVAAAPSAAAAGLELALKMSLGYPDNWQPLESMSYAEVEVDKGSSEYASIAVLMNGTIAAFHKVGKAEWFFS